MELLDLSTLFLTKAQALDISARLSLVMDRVYTSGFSLEATLSEHLGLTKKERILKLFRENTISETNPTAIQAFLKQLQDTIAKLPVVTITIAFEPRDETLKAISEWFLFTLKKHVLIDLEIDKSLLAGARITCNGKYKEYSFRDTFITSMNAFFAEKNQPATSSTQKAPVTVQPTSVQSEKPNQAAQ